MELTKIMRAVDHLEVDQPAVQELCVDQTHAHTDDPPPP